MGAASGYGDDYDGNLPLDRSGPPARAAGSQGGVGKAGGLVSDELAVRFCGGKLLLQAAVHYLLAKVAANLRNIAAERDHCVCWLFFWGRQGPIYSCGSSFGYCRSLARHRGPIAIAFWRRSISRGGESGKYDGKYELVHFSIPEVS